MLARLAVRSGRSKDIEIIVLRHQLRVLHGQNNRPDLTENDRSLKVSLRQPEIIVCESPHAFRRQ